MKLTSEQKAQIGRQRRDDPDRRRFHIEATAEQRAEREEAFRLEEVGREENVASVRRQMAAREELGFSGDLRRAMPAKLRERHELAKKASLDPDRLERFYVGDAELASSDVDRLTEVLGLHLARQRLRPTGSAEKT